jgi:hypothetical protein
MTSVANGIKLFAVIYAASGVFPYDFDRGYAESVAVTAQKAF